MRNDYLAKFYHPESFAGAGNSVKVHAPGTVANMVCGFDILGFALNDPCDVMEVTLIDGKQVIIHPDEEYNLPLIRKKMLQVQPCLQCSNWFRRILDLK
jgi:homoserine kinase